MTTFDKPEFFARLAHKFLLRGFCLITLLCFVSITQAQTFDDFKKQVRQEYNDFEKSTREKFDDFVEKVDKEFTVYLADNFGSYATERIIRSTLEPKPDALPKAIKTSTDLPAEMIAYSLPKRDYSIRQGPILPNIKKSETIDFETDSVNVVFLGWPLYFKSDKKLKVAFHKTLNAQKISEYWAELATTNYNHLLYQLNQTKEILNLNDWAYYQLIKSFTQQLHPQDVNNQVLLQWVLLSRSRYKVKVAYANNEVFLLVSTIYPLYGTDFLRFDGLEYYVMEGKTKGLNTYAVDFPEADIIMDLRIAKPFYTEPKSKTTRAYQFYYEGIKHILKLDFDPAMIKFYETVPVSDVRVYFNSVCSELTNNSLIDAFTPLIKDKTDVEAADLLLQFVQQAFDYKTDQQAFGHERYFFAEEILNYPYSDCEDRSVFYAYLIKTLLKTEIVGVGFPGHMATALHFKNNPPGYYLNYKDKNFVIADPTFYDASIGMLMPMAKGKNAELVLTENRATKCTQAEELWALVRQAGGSKADLLEDVIFDQKGHAYVCGYFTKKVQLGDFSIESNYPGRDVFIAKFDNTKNPLWINKATGPGNDLAFSMAIREDGSVFLYGSLEDELSFGNTQLQAVGAPDVFVAKYTPNGLLQWARKAGIDKLDHNANFMFAAKFNADGKKIMAKLYSETENFSHYGLSLDKKENALITGSFFATPGMNSNDFKKYDDLSNLEIPKALKEENDDLIELNYEQTIAGLFAALNLIRYNNFELKGTDVQKVFDEYNEEDFVSLSNNFYKNFGKMKFIKNKGGIIAIKTESEKSLTFDMIKVENEARIKIIKYKSGNVAVQIFSGIFVGNNKKWLGLNTIKLFKENGDILFDFGDNNTTKKLNLKKEILKR